MKLRVVKKDETKCPIPGCWKTSRKGRLCTACAAWWYRVQLKTAGELAEYYNRAHRMSNRLVSPRFTNLRRGKKAS